VFLFLFKSKHRREAMFPFLKLSDEIISLRPFEFGEEDQLHKAVQESLPHLKPWMAWANEDYSSDVARNFIAITRAQWSSGVMYAFAITDTTTGELLGGCSLSHIHPVYHFCNLGYWVRSNRHGQGIAGRAAKLVGKFAFEKVKLIRAEIVIAVGNGPSKRVAEKVGAHYEGILLNRMVVGRDIYDAHMFSLLPSDFGLLAQL
jgi:ribosomal-protein-serine acetyltransferase